jgi:hypothetical protein
MILGMTCSRDRGLAKFVGAVVILATGITTAGCGASHPSVSGGGAEAESRGRANQFYCNTATAAPLTASAPEGVIPIDIDPSPLTQTCREVQRRLDTHDAGASGADAALTAADEALRPVCIARRCIVWRKAVAASERAIVRLTCLGARLQDLDVALQVGVDAREMLAAALDRGDRETVAHERGAFGMLERKSERLRSQAESCEPLN